MKISIYQLLNSLRICALKGDSTLWWQFLNVNFDKPILSLIVWCLENEQINLNRGMRYIYGALTIVLAFSLALYKFRAN